MNKIKSIIILLIIIPLSSYGQEILSLEQCRDMAIENNKQMSIAGKNKEKAVTTSKAYMTNFFPKFSASGLGYYSNSETNMDVKLGDIQLFDPNSIGGMIPPGLEPIFNELSVVSIPDLNFNLKTNNTYMAGVSAEQPIYMGGKIAAAYKMSKIGTEIAELNLNLTKAEVITETDRAYWLCIQAMELQKSAKKYKEVVEEFYRVVKNATEAGMKSKNDMMKVQVQLNQAELQLRRAENAVKLSKMNLCYITGMPVNSDFILQQSFNEQLIEINEDADITSRPEYSMLTRQIELKTQEKRLVQSDFMPNLGVKASYNYIHGLKLNNELLFNSASFSAMISLNIPLFHWGEGAKKIKAAETDKIIMQLQRDEIGEKMNLELEKALNSYNEALMEVELTKTALSQSEENLKMSQDHYEAGMESISDYLEAQAIWQNAESEHIVARTKLEICKTEYLKAAGEL